MATLTVTQTAAEDLRCQVAYGHVLGLGRNATLGEVKAEIIRHHVALVAADEDRVAREALVPAAPIAPT